MKDKRREYDKKLDKYGSFLVTAFGICLAVLIAFGGLFFMKYQLNQSEKKLLSASGKVAISNVSSTVKTSASSKERLTEQELIQALQSLNCEGEEYPHEPMEGQLTMKQAIKKGKEWLILLDHYGMDSIGISVLEFDEINAKLCVKKAEGKAVNKILYSYWKIIYKNNAVTSELVLNAVTGQVLHASITPFQYTPALIKLERAELLSDYSTSFQLGAGNILGENKRELYYFFNTGRLYAFLKIEDMIEKEAGKKVVTKRKKSCLVLSVETTEQIVYDASGSETIMSKASTQ